MRTKFASIDPDPSLPIDRPKMQKDMMIGPGGVHFSVFLRHAERSAIPERVVGSNESHHPRQRRLDGKRDENSIRLPFRWLTELFGMDGILPQSIQIVPMFTDKLGTRIVWMNRFRRHICRPFRHEGRLFRLPIGGINRQTQTANSHYA